MPCPACGSSVPEGLAFCPQCGTCRDPRLRETPPRTGAAPHAGRARRTRSGPLPPPLQGENPLGASGIAPPHRGPPVQGALRGASPSGPYTFTVALLLAILPFCFGFAGLHRLYTGRVVSGLIQLFTFGGFMIWQLVDVIRICTGGFTDADGLLLQRP